MPPQRKVIDPCGVDGHKIQSIKKGVRVLPGNSRLGADQLVDDFAVMCTCCGRTLDEIRENAEYLKKDSTIETS